MINNSGLLFWATLYMHQTLIQLVDVVNARLAHTLLHGAPDLAVHCVKVGTVWWPQWSS